MWPVTVGCVPEAAVYGPPSVQQTLGGLPVVASFLDQLGVAAIIDGLCPIRDVALATHGQVIEAMIANRLTSERWSASSTGPRWAVELGGAERGDAERDDRGARAGRAPRARGPSTEARGRRRPDGRADGGPTGRRWRREGGDGDRAGTPGRARRPDHRVREPGEVTRARRRRRAAARRARRVAPLRDPPRWGAAWRLARGPRARRRPRRRARARGAERRDAPRAPTAPPGPRRTREPQRPPRRPARPSPAGERRYGNSGPARVADVLQPRRIAR